MDIGQAIPEPNMASLKTLSATSMPPSRKIAPSSASKQLAIACLQNITELKGPKLEIFVAEFFTQSNPVWVDDLGT
jgi:hypothetical protein